MLDFDWYNRPPIDFEHKQYLLFAYLKEVDDSFYQKTFSPFLLYTENLVHEMRRSAKSIEGFEKSLQKKKIFFDGFSTSIVTQKPVRPGEIDTMIEIIDFSIPLLEQRVELGRKLHKKFPSILY